MKRNELIRWGQAVAAALGWMLFRLAGKGLPAAALACLETGLAAGLMALYAREKGREVFRLSGKAVLFGAAAAAAAGVLARLCFGRPEGDASFWLLLSRCGVGPLAEETLYRGLIYDRVYREDRPGAAIWVSALLFATAHGSLPRMVAAFAAGLLLGAGRKKTGTVTVPAVMHMILNILQWT